MIRWLLLPLLLLGLAGCNDNGPAKMDWSYMVGSNADEIWHTRALFSREGVRTHESSNGVVSVVGERLLKEKDYRWDVGKGRSFYGQPVPDKVEIEWVSYHDKKRYGITLELPKDLGKQMAQRYRLNNGQIKQRNVMGLGFAPGGYVEVFLTNPKVQPDVLIASGMAHEVNDDWYDKKMPLNRQYGIDEFTEQFGALYQKYPIPTGEAWAPIMDAYRAAQPKTDTDPVN
ncbi:hypothetical protein HNP12_000503 [Aeromonas hydrophila]|uniref:DUF2931 family protein n=1 Tax=Aeromonas hydrophila TaxID=644 RepID=UPI0021682B7A|nr:DUF2931 family protein [Aeromonas hydrophila]MCS3766464.1 hypothetical protein [Aeromonas hydrophila]